MASHKEHRHDHAPGHASGAHAHSHAHDHAHPHDHTHDHDHAHEYEQGDWHEPRLKHSFLIPRPYRSRSSIRLQPLSELGPELQKSFEELIERHTGGHSEPFRGVTTDGHVVPDLFHIGQTGLTLQPVLAAARDFLAALSPAERETATFDIDSIEWRRWSNGHAYHFRHGVCLHYLSDDKRKAALRLMRETLSAAGYESARNIMRLNEHILELTGLPDEYGEWHYFVSIFGEPSSEKPWGWQIDGHHLIINCFVLGDQMVMTPTFYGSEPVYAESGIYKGTRVLEEEESRGYELMKSLGPSQRNAATISDELPRQLFTIAPWDNRILENRGIPFADMNSGQKELLHRLIEIYTGRMRPGHAEIELETAKKFLNGTKFAWIGPCDDVSPFYYRVQSPAILIEFDHQSGVAFQGPPSRSHIHTVVRTPNGNDYGRDLLRQHHLQFDHSKPGEPHRGRG